MSNRDEFVDDARRGFNLLTTAPPQTPVHPGSDALPPRGPRVAAAVGDRGGALGTLDGADQGPGVDPPRALGNAVRAAGGGRR